MAGFGETGDATDGDRNGRALAALCDTATGLFVSDNGSGGGAGSSGSCAAGMPFIRWPCHNTISAR